MSHYTETLQRNVSALKLVAARRCVSPVQKAHQLLVHLKKQLRLQRKRRNNMSEAMKIAPRESWSRC